MGDDSELAPAQLLSTVAGSHPPPLAESAKNPPQEVVPAESAKSPPQEVVAPQSPEEVVLRSLAERANASTLAAAPVSTHLGGGWQHVTASLSALQPDEGRHGEVVKQIVSRHSEAAMLSAWEDPAPECASVEGGRAGLLWEAEHALDGVLLLGTPCAVSMAARRWRRAAKHAHTVLRKARKRPSVARRALALFLVAQIVHVAARQAGASPPRVFEDAREGDGEPSPRAAAAHARGGLDPFAGADAEAPRLIPHMIGRAYLQQLKETASGEHPQRRAHAADPSRMMQASPFAEAGGADERGKKQLAAGVAELKARVAAGEGVEARPLAAGADEAPAVDGPRLVRAHLKELCPDCAVGACGIWEVAAMATAYTLPFREKCRPTGGRGPTTYALTLEERVAQAAKVAELVASGRAHEVEHPTVVSPTFFAHKHRYAESCGWAAKELAAPGLSERLDEACSGVWRVATEAAPTAAALTRAMAEKSVAESRLVFDYSGVVNSAGVKWPFQLTSVQEVLMAIRPGDWVSSVDVQSGFHHVTMHPADRGYLAFEDLVSGKLYAPTRLMFGLASAPAGFSAVTGELVATAQRRIDRLLGPASSVKLFCYVDDVFIVGPSQAFTQKALDLLHEYCAEVGVKLKSEKTRPPSQDAAVLGLRVDTLKGVVYLPADKKYNILFDIHALLGMAARGCGLPVSIIRKVAGKLNHACAVWPSGVGHLAPLYEASAGRGERLLPAKDAESVLSALRYFQDVLRRGRATDALSVPLPASPDAPPWVTTSGDASGDVGFGLSCGPVVLWGRWDAPTAEPSVSIGLKEMYPWVLFQEEMGDLLEGFTWLPSCDNLPNCFSVLKGHTKDEGLRPWLAALFCARAGGLVFPRWTPRCFNQFQDDVSKAASLGEVWAAMAKFWVGGGVRESDV